MEQLSLLKTFYLDVVLNSTIIYLFLTSVFVDIITGNLAALYKGQWNSRTGLTGTIRHLSILTIVIFLLPMICYIMDTPIISNGVITYIIGQYTISIIENAKILGFDLKDSFGKYFKYLDDDNKKQDEK